MVDTARDFSGSIPEHYDTILGPAILERMAADLVRRMPVRPKSEVLELACGTGILTQRLRERVDASFRVVATDLSDDMLAYARTRVKGKIDWRKADAAALPFKEQTFGAVVRRLGVMFVPKKQKVFPEARRVLVEGGLLRFNSWDSLEVNPEGRAAAELMDGMFPGDAEMQFTRIPFGFNDETTIRRLLDDARFADVRIDRVAYEVKAPSARMLATGQVRGTPRAALFEKRGVKLDDVIDRLAERLASLGGAEPYRSERRALVVQAKAI